MNERSRSRSNSSLTKTFGILLIVFTTLSLGVTIYNGIVAGMLGDGWLLWETVSLQSVTSVLLLVAGGAAVQTGNTGSHSMAKLMFVCIALSALIMFGQMMAQVVLMVTGSSICDQLQVMVSGYESVRGRASLACCFALSPRRRSPAGARGHSIPCRARLS